MTKKEMKNEVRRIIKEYQKTQKLSYYSAGSNVRQAVHEVNDELWQRRWKR